MPWSSSLGQRCPHMSQHDGVRTRFGGHVQSDRRLLLIPVALLIDLIHKKKKGSTIMHWECADGATMDTANWHRQLSRRHRTIRD
ncbi:unnamed protein product [Mesocestoides corti]|uniref:Uncharacterized protein n=1 Tax=Mesocestoides corti TaxID=53468 RepID=A0A0R3U2D7_MESCO|nr:unnamed protein product [Mesocestoides corti]